VVADIVVTVNVEAVVETAVIMVGTVEVAGVVMGGVLHLLTIGLVPEGITDPVLAPIHLVVTDSNWGPRDRRWIFPKSTQ